MTLIAPHITAFLTEHLPFERGAGRNTCESYAYAFQLLFVYASERFSTSPSTLHFEQLDAQLIVDFLSYLESQRGNSPNSRNIRLAAIKSFMRYMQFRLPSALEQIQRVLAIATKRTDTRLVDYLTAVEMQSVLDAPSPTTRSGIRDCAMLHLGFAAGLRVSELVGLQIVDIELRQFPTITVHGKGRRERSLPLWKETARAVRAWVAVRGEGLGPELFLNARGEAMTRSGFEYVLRKHVRSASEECPSLLTKRVSPHVLRHTCAMIVLSATNDIRKVSLWLGHSSIQTTEMYTRADKTENFQTLEAMVPPKLRTGRFKATDKLLDTLKSARLCGVEGGNRG